MITEFRPDRSGIDIEGFGQAGDIIRSGFGLCVKESCYPTFVPSDRFAEVAETKTWNIELDRFRSKGVR